MDVNNISLHEFAIYMTNQSLQNKTPVLILSNGQTPLIHVLYNADRIDILAWISNTYGADTITAATISNGITILHLAAQGNESRMLRLLDICDRPNVENIEGISPLHLFMAHGSVVSIKHILDRHSDTNIAKVLNNALNLKRNDIVKMLVTISTKIGSEFVYKEIQNKNYEAVNMLLDVSDVNYKDPQTGTTLLDIATLNGELPLINKLEHMHAKLSICDEDIDDDDKCPICQNMLYEPVTFLCKHTFCRYCIMQSIKDKGSDDVHCVYLCETGKMPLFPLVDSKKKDSLIDMYGVELYATRRNIFYITRANQLVSKLNDDAYIPSSNQYFHYENGLESHIIHMDKYIQIDVGLNMTLPTNQQQRLSMIQSLLDSNKISQSLGMGSIYIRPSGMIASHITIPLELVNTSAVASIVHSMIHIAHIFTTRISNHLISDITSRIQTDVIDTNDIFLFETNPIRFATAIEKFKNSSNVQIKVMSDSYRYRIDNDCDIMYTDGIIILMKKITNIDPNNISACEFILQQKIDMVYIHVAAPHGSVWAHMVILFGSTYEDIIKEHYHPFICRCAILTKSINIRCR
jgi:hypothetical protein